MSNFNEKRLKTEGDDINDDNSKVNFDLNADDDQMSEDVVRLPDYTSQTKTVNGDSKATSTVSGKQQMILSNYNILLNNLESKLKKVNNKQLKEKENQFLLTNDNLNIFKKLKLAQSGYKN